MKIAAYACTLALGMTSALGASAQTEAAEGAPPPVEGPAEATAEPTSEPAPAAGPEAQSGPAAPADESAPKDGARFRFGVSGGFGPMFVDGYTFMYSGIDLRFGVQINDLIAVYAQPQLGGYWISDASTFGAGGLIGASALVDFTFIDHLFVGVGLGYAILNSPSGLEVHARLGGYPLMGRLKEKARRRGLMLGADLRLHILDGYDPIFAPTFAIGYDAF